MKKAIDNPVNIIYTEYNKSLSQYGVYSSIRKNHSHNINLHVLCEHYYNYIFNGIFDNEYEALNIGTFLFKNNPNISKDEIVERYINFEKKLKRKNKISSAFTIIQKNNNDKHKVFICNIGDSAIILLKKCDNYKQCFMTKNNNILDVIEFECEDEDILVYISSGITQLCFDENKICGIIKNNINKCDDLRNLTSLICLEVSKKDDQKNLSCMIIKLGSCGKNEFKKDTIHDSCISQQNSFFY